MSIKRFSKAIFISWSHKTWEWKCQHRKGKASLLLNISNVKTVAAVGNSALSFYSYKHGNSWPSKILRLWKKFSFHHHSKHVDTFILVTMILTLYSISLLNTLRRIKNKQTKNTSVPGAHSQRFRLQGFGLDWTPVPAFPQARQVTLAHRRLRITVMVRVPCQELSRI